MLEQPEWNQLSLSHDKLDFDFIDELNKIINNEHVLNAPDDLPRYKGNDTYINMELGLPRGLDGSLEYPKVKKRAVDVDGRPVGKAHDNPLFDTRQYKVEYNDGTTEVVTANTIVENTLSQVDQDGHKQQLLL